MLLTVYMVLLVYIVDSCSAVLPGEGLGADRSPSRVPPTLPGRRLAFVGDPTARGLPGLVSVAATSGMFPA